MILYGAAYQPRWPTLAWTFHELKLYATTAFLCGFGALAISAIGIGPGEISILATALIVLAGGWFIYSKTRSRSDQFLENLLLDMQAMQKEMFLNRQEHHEVQRGILERSRHEFNMHKKELWEILKHQERVLESFMNATRQAFTNSPLERRDFLLSRSIDTAMSPGLSNFLQTENSKETRVLRVRHPMDRGALQSKLGILLLHHGELTKDTNVLRQAETAFREALAVRTRETAPLEWAATLSGLGTVLLNIGHITSEARPLKEAEAIFRATLEVYAREQSHADTAATLSNLATVLMYSGQLSGDTGEVTQAEMAFREALEVLTRAEAAFRETLEAQSRN